MTDKAMIAIGAASILITLGTITFLAWITVWP